MVNEDETCVSEFFISTRKEIGSKNGVDDATRRDLLKEYRKKLHKRRLISRQERDTENKMESVFNQMAAYDFSAPVAVTMVFEESDGENSSSCNNTIQDIVQDKNSVNITQADKNRQSPVLSTGNQVNEMIQGENNSDLIIKTEREEPINNSVLQVNADKLTNISYEKRTNKNNEYVTVSDGTIVNSFTNRVEPENDLPVKRKANDIPEFRPEKHRKNDAIEKDVTNNVNIPINSVTQSSLTQDVVSERFFDKLILERLSENIIKIRQEYMRYQTLLSNLKNNNRKETDRSLAYFYHIKYKLFNWSFSALSSILIHYSQLNSFTDKFLNDTVKHGCEKYFLKCTYQDIYPIWIEMIEWAREKKWHLLNLSSRLEQANNQQNHAPRLEQTNKQQNHAPRLEQTKNQLNHPPRLEHTNNQQEINKPPSAPKSNSNTTTFSERSVAFPYANVAAEPQNSSNVLFSPPNNNYLANAFTESLSSRSNVSDLSAYIQNSGRPRIPADMSANNTRMSCIATANNNLAINPNNAMSYNCGTQSKNPANAYNAAKSTQKYNLISGQALDENLLPPTNPSNNATCDSNNFNNLIINHNTLRVAPQLSSQPSLNQPPYISTPSNMNMSANPFNHSNYLLGLLTKGVPAETSRSINFPAPPSNNKSMATNTSQCVLFSSGPPGREVQLSVDPFISRNALLNQNAARQSNAARSNATAHQLPHNQFPQRNGGYGYEPHFEQTAHLQNSALPQICTVPTCPLPPPPPYNALHNTASVMDITQNQPSVLHQMRVEKRSVSRETSDQVNSRSLSTDSGFTSPLHFNNSPSEATITPNNDQEDHNSSLLITHVTSLNPKATYINAGPCCVCGKMTKHMCLGCVKNYYCSPNCQRTDWSYHKYQCNKT